MNDLKARQKFPVYLYVKTHNQTGLKYFGRTISHNPEKYKGSGMWWRRHLKVHGDDMMTEIVAVFHEEGGLYEFATDFSKKHNIVNSTLWANLIVEDGFGGGFGPVSEDRRKQMSAESASRRWCTNGITEKFVSECPPNWSAGRLPSKVKGKTTSLKGRPMSEEDKAKRRKPQNKTNHRKPNKPASSERKEKLAKKRWWKSNTLSVFSDVCPEGFVAGRILHSYCRHPS